jgi:hypothetical protein
MHGCLCMRVRECESMCLCVCVCVCAGACIHMGCAFASHLLSGDILRPSKGDFGSLITPFLAEAEAEAAYSSACSS